MRAKRRRTSKLTSIDPNCALLAAHHYAFQQPSRACDAPARKDGENDISNATSNCFSINVSPLPFKFLRDRQATSIAEQITKCTRE